MGTKREMPTTKEELYVYYLGAKDKNIQSGFSNRKGRDIWQLCVYL
jgi:hypothetical protein